MDERDDPVADGRAGVLATGYTDMRKGFATLSLQVQEILHRDPLSGHLFCFRGRRGNLLKVMALWPGRLERGRFLRPSPADGVVAISPAQLGYLLSGIDWRHTHRRRGGRHRSADDFNLRMTMDVILSSS